MRAVFVALSLSVCVVAAGCGKSSEKTYVSKDGSVTVSNSGNAGHMTVNSGNGTATMDFNADGGVHATMPDFAPLYPGAKVTSSVVANNTDGTKGAQVSFTVAAPPADVIAFYKQHVGTANLPQTMSVDQGDTMMFMAGKDKKAVTVTVGKQDGGSQVMVIWTDK
jgi:hypothetical protein